MNAETLDPMERLLAERACERLVVEFAHRLDLGDPGSVADLFTQGGTWEWPAGDRRIAGHDALRIYFGNRPADRLSRRICTNILGTVTSADTAAATTYWRLVLARRPGPNRERITHYRIDEARAMHRMGRSGEAVVTLRAAAQRAPDSGRAGRSGRGAGD